MTTIKPPSSKRARSFSRAQQCHELWLCAEAGGVKGMNGCAFALTIAVLLVEHTSLARLEASAHVEGECVRDMMRW